MFSRSIDNLLNERSAAFGAFEKVLSKLKATNDKLTAFIEASHKDIEALEANILERENSVLVAEDAIQKSNKTIQNIEAILN